MDAPMRPAVLLAPPMVECSMVTSLVWRRLMPKKSPLLVTSTLSTVTLLAWMFSTPLMCRPVMVAPFAVTSTVWVLAFQAHPGPLVAWPGTAVRRVPAGTPLFVASGNPHVLGLGEQLVLVAAAAC